MESPWHLQWKLAHLKLKGWQIEVPIQIGDKRYVLDAYHQGTGRIREFVHSLSPYYVQKHLDLLSAGHKVQWIFDGAVFVSAHAVHVKQGTGRKCLLKPKAHDICMRVGGFVHFEAKTVVEAIPDKYSLFAEPIVKTTHYQAVLWTHWRDDVWFKQEGADLVLSSFEEAALEADR